MQAKTRAQNHEKKQDTYTISKAAFHRKATKRKIKTLQ